MHTRYRSTDTYSHTGEVHTCLPVHVHARTRTHTLKHMLTHTCTHAQIHARMHTCMHMDTHAHVCKRSYTHIHMCTHARTHARTHSLSPLAFLLLFCRALTDPQRRQTAHCHSHEWFGGPEAPGEGHGAGRALGLCRMHHKPRILKSPGLLSFLHTGRRTRTREQPASQCLLRPSRVLFGLLVAHQQFLLRWKNRLPFGGRGAHTSLRGLQ